MKRRHPEPSPPKSDKGRDDERKRRRVRKSIRGLHASAVATEGIPRLGLSDLPTEVLSSVLQRCDPTYRVPCAFVCRLWRDIVSAKDAGRRAGDSPSASPLNLCRDLAEKGDVPVMRWARSQGAPWNDAVTSAAARGGHIDVLRLWKKESGRSWSPYACSEAARWGHLDTLIWLHTNGAPWLDDDPDLGDECASAARNGHLHVLQWAVANAAPHSPTRICSEAALGGHVAVLEWVAAQRGWTVSPNIIDAAAYAGHLHIMQWAWDNCASVFPRHMAGTVWAAAISGHVHVLRWLRAMRLVPSDMDPSWVTDHIGRIGDEKVKAELAEWYRQHGDSACDTRGGTSVG